MCCIVTRGRAIICVCTLLCLIAPGGHLDHVSTESSSYTWRSTARGRACRRGVYVGLLGYVPGGSGVVFPQNVESFVECNSDRASLKAFGLRVS